MKSLNPRFLCVLLLTFLVIGCQTGRVSSGSAPRFAAAEYRSFAILPFKMDEEARRAGAVVLDTIRRTITKELESKGLNAADLRQADLLVVVDGEITPRVTVRPQLAHTSLPHDHLVNFETDTYYDGALVLSLFDRERSERVWWGWYAENARGPQPDPDRVAGAIRRVLMEYPQR